MQASGQMTATVPWLPRCLLDAAAYGVLVPHRLGDQSPAEGCVAVVAVSLGDRARLELPSAPLVLASV